MNGWLTLSLRWRAVDIDVDLYAALYDSTSWHNSGRWPSFVDEVVGGMRVSHRTKFLQRVCGAACLGA